MRKISLFVLTVLLTVSFAGCGGGSRPQPQTSVIAFLQQSSNQSSALFTPMLGTFSVTGGNVQFTAKPAAIDSGTGQAVSAPFGSIAVSANSKKATFDLFGGTIDLPSSQWDIWVANSDGTGLVQVTNDSYEDALPQFSPDGSKVIYMSMRPVAGGLSQWQVVIRNVNGSGEQVLHFPAGMIYTGQPTYSPDGSKIALAATGMNAGVAFEGIYMVNSDGSNPHVLTNPCSSTLSCVDQLPAYSADGSKIFFSRDDWSNIPEVEDIYVMNADGSRVTKLTNSVGVKFDPLALNIAGLGERVLFSSSSNPTDDSSFDLYSMKTDGSGQTRLTTNSLYDGFCTEWYGSTGSAAIRQVQEHYRQPHPQAYYPIQRPNWR